jgi:drug/metabolite transporter (DMT)-like permease
VVAIVIAALLWGSAFPGIKRGYSLLGIDPEQGLGDALAFAGIRFLVAGLMLLGGAWIFRLGVVVRGPGALWRLGLLGLIQTTLQYTTFYIGMVYTTGVKASIIVASGSFFLAGLSPLFYTDDKLNARRATGLVMGFGGVVVANLARTTSVDLEVEWLGDGLILVAGLCSAVASLLSKKLVQDIHPVVVNGYQATFGALVLLCVAAPSTDLEMARIDVELVVLMLYLAVVTATAFTLYYLVVKFHDLSRVAAYRFLIPLSGVGLSAALIPGESLQWSLALAAGLVGAGIWVVNRRVASGNAKKA